MNIAKYFHYNTETLPFTVLGIMLIFIGKSSSTCRSHRTRSRSSLMWSHRRWQWTQCSRAASVESATASSASGSPRRRCLTSLPEWMGSSAGMSASALAATMCRAGLRSSSERLDQCSLSSSEGPWGSSILMTPWTQFPLTVSAGSGVWWLLVSSTTMRESFSQVTDRFLVSSLSVRYPCSCSQFSSHSCSSTP